jgi:PEGA domain
MRRLAIVLAVVVSATVVYADDGYIKARGSPSAAAIFVDGKYVGPAYRFTVPEKYPIPAGAVEVIFRDPRYEDYVTKITVSPHKTTKIHYTLKKLPVPEPPFGRFRLGGGEAESFLSVAAGDTGAVYINNKYYGYVDELNNAGGGLLLKPGTYELHVVSPRFGDFKRQINIEANKVTVVPLETTKE